MMVKVKTNTQTGAGFTIVELLIVIVVIGILAAITIVAYNGIQQRARDAERQQDIASVQKVLEMYYIDNGRFPGRFDLPDPSWRAANLATKDQSIFINPQDSGSTNSITGSGSTVTLDKYSYYETPNGVGSGYKLVYKLEANPTVNIIINVDR